MELSWRDLPGWQKALVLGTGAVAAAGLVYYLVRDAEDAEEGDDLPVQELPPGVFFKVSDPKGANVGLRTRPDASDESRCGDKKVLMSGEIFEVSAIVVGEGEQKFLKLADGRGWAFTQSAKDGRTLCTPAASGEKGGIAESQIEEIKGLFPPGEYRLINEGFPTAEQSTESPDIGELAPGTVVKIAEVVVLLDEKRVRGRMEEPAKGWLSLLKLDDGYRWVVPAKLPGSADMPAGSQQRMIYDQLKMMFEERKEVLDQVVEQAKDDKMFPEFGERFAAGEDQTTVAAEYQMAMMMVSGMGR